MSHIRWLLNSVKAVFLEHVEKFQKIMKTDKESSQTQREW